MWHMNSYKWAVAGCILSILTIVGATFGIWGLFMLQQPETKERFREVMALEKEMRDGRA